MQNPFIPVKRVYTPSCGGCAKFEGAFFVAEKIGINRTAPGCKRSEPAYGRTNPCPHPRADVGYSALGPYLRECKEINFTIPEGFLFEGKEAKVARTQTYVRLSPTQTSGKKTREA